MALALDLTYAQSNDAETLTLTDSAGTYHAVDNDDGWEIGGATNEDVNDIVVTTDVSTGSKYHLVLDIVVTDKNGTETTYDEIDCYAVAGPFTDAGDLIFPLTADLFDVSGTAMGDSGDKLDDGTYNITYTLRDNVTPFAEVDAFTETVVVDGDVRIDVYNKLRQVSVDYDNEENDTSRDVMEALFAYTYLQTIEAGAAVAMEEELINQLYTLDKLVSDGSHYTW